MEKFSLPARQYVIPHKHKYSIGDRVRNISNADWNKHYGKEGVITKLLPFGAAAPAYDVRYGDMVAVALEKSIERIEVTETEQCEICARSISVYRECDKCSDILCINCAYDSEGIAFCRECFAEYEKEQEETEE